MPGFGKRLGIFGLAAASLGLSACAYDGYGYGGVSAGYGSGGYYGYDDYYGRPYGWYDGYYYPGNGYYVYDRAGHRQRWSDNHRRYWQGRGNGAGRPDRPGRPDRGEWAGRPDRPDRGEWAGRPDRPDRPDRGGSIGRPDRNDRGDNRGRWFGRDGAPRQDAPRAGAGFRDRDVVRQRSDAGEGRGVWGGIPNNARANAVERAPRTTAEPRSVPSRDGRAFRPRTRD